MAEETTMSAEQVRAFVEDVLTIARPAMRRALGESTRAYNQADVIAEGIAGGARQALVNAGLAEGVG